MVAAISSDLPLSLSEIHSPMRWKLCLNLVHTGTPVPKSLLTLRLSSYRKVSVAQIADVLRGRRRKDY